jgi:hypothetical protein
VDLPGAGDIVTRRLKASRKLAMPVGVPACLLKPAQKQSGKVDGVAIRRNVQRGGKRCYFGPEAPAVLVDPVDPMRKVPNRLQAPVQFLKQRQGFFHPSRGGAGFPPQPFHQLRP